MSSRSQNLAKYQDESKNVSNVSVSLSASFMQFGHFVFFQLGWCSNGFPGLSKVTSSGSLTGRSSDFTGTGPHSLQCIIGIGHPQYRCLDIPQSLSLKLVSFSPLLFNVKRSEAFSLASSILKPFKNSELIIFPSPV